MMIGVRQNSGRLIFWFGVECRWHIFFSRVILLFFLISNLGANNAAPSASFYLLASIPPRVSQDSEAISWVRVFFFFVLSLSLAPPRFFFWLIDSIDCLLHMHRCFGVEGRVDADESNFGWLFRFEPGIKRGLIGDRARRRSNGQGASVARTGWMS